MKVIVGIAPNSQPNADATTLEVEAPDAIATTRNWLNAMDLLEPLAPSGFHIVTYRIKANEEQRP